MTVRVYKFMNVVTISLLAYGAVDVMDDNNFAFTPDENINLEVSQAIN